MTEAPLVAVCMATFNPDLRLFEQQVTSIREQTYERILCFVRDDGSEREVLEAIERICAPDGRFSVTSGGVRLGFYRNFERCLELVPGDAEFVAFSDQDDVWHADKLNTLLAALGSPGPLLSYSDMNIVSEDGRLLAPSYWTHRRNNYTDLGSLILANTVTGAASLFRRELLDDALPFPRVPGVAYHDHWIACVALALGEIVFVDQALHDYVQHGGNVVGRHEPLDELKGGLVNALRRFVRHPRRRWRNTIAHASKYYEDDVVPRELFARTLEQRLGYRLSPPRAREVRRVARLSSSLESLGWLVARSAQDVRGRSETLGLENQLIKGIVWHRMRAARARVRRARARFL